MEYKEFFANVIQELYPNSFRLSEFEKVPSFAGKYRYANERLTKIASGSGRTVFKIDDKMVLKIAKNKKGLAQNSVEAEYYLQNYDIVARVFDTDRNDFWVEMELAQKVGKNRFKQLTGISIELLEVYLRYRQSLNNPGGYRPPAWHSKEELSSIEDNNFVADLTSLIDNYDFSEVGDFGRLSTYGEVSRDGQPKIVLVDFGLTNSVYNDYYRVNP